MLLPMLGSEGRLRCRLILNDTGLYFYLFLIGETVYGIGEEDNGLLYENGRAFQISVVPSEHSVPRWSHGAIMYQILPDRFAKGKEHDLSDKLTPYTVHSSTAESPRIGPDEQGHWNNDFFGGDLFGITKRLDYLQSLGVGVIYLNPIFLSFSNHRYDTADYHRIDPMLGDEADLQLLCQEAHAKGMHVILDGVFSHVGSDSKYFDARGRFGCGAVSDPNSPYRSWFHFRSYPGDYQCWWDIPTLPCVNEMDPTFLREIISGQDSVINHYTKLGIDGFRLDVADELPDAFIACFRRALREKKRDSFLIGEVWEDATNKISYGERRRYFTDCELDSVMNYPLRSMILDLIKGKLPAAKFVSSVMELIEHYPKRSLHALMNLLSSHDTPRLRTELCVIAEEDRKAALKAAVALQYLLPGMPCIYYGDEIGMMGGADPDNRRFFCEDQTDEEILAFYRLMGALKRKHTALQVGETALRSTGNMITVKRWCDEEAIELTLALSSGLASFPAGCEVLYASRIDSDRPYAIQIIKI